MTGTPIKNKPVDVYTPLKLVDGHEIKSFYQWSHIFCIFGGYGGHEIMGYKNIPMLKDMLQVNMIRRMKSEVLDLPPKIYFNEYVDNTPYQQDLYDAVCEEIYEKKEEILSSLNPLTAMLRLRQINGSPELVDDTIQIDDKYLSKNAKLTRLIEIIDDIIERDEKVIVFSNWVEPLRTIYHFISKKYKTCCYTGTMSEADREKHKKVFINNPEYKIMLGTIGAMGVSLTLTVATNVIFYDDCWTPADKEQASDRCMRIGQTNSLNVYTLMAKDTIDEKVRQILENKKGIASYIVDDKLDLKANPQLFDFLLGRE
jgi:SNF2 family DNA or RNA helicase